MSLTLTLWRLALLILAFEAWPQIARAADPPPRPAVAENASAKPVYYPLGMQAPLRVGEEGYQESYVALRGLTGVYVNVDDVLSGAQSRNVKLPTNFKDEVARRLNSAGMRLLGKEELAQTPGQPELNMYLSFPRHMNPPTSNEPAVVYRPDCCLATIWTSFSQGTTTLRDPVSPIKQSTWGEGHNTADCADLGTWFMNVMMKTLDAFTAAKLKADQVARKPSAQAAPATPASTGNMECNSALMLYIEMFSTGSAKIMTSKYFVLDKLAASMKSCPTYNYMIETHADQRGDAAFNEKLTQERAASIRQYLVSKGVGDSRFELQSFGRDKLVTTSTTEEDYAANRRVVVTPYKVKAKL
jgi:outer membrane protein OmpA-like peptidoglycan-associated protein